MVPGGRIELPTRDFSGLRSTTELPWRLSDEYSPTHLHIVRESNPLPSAKGRGDHHIDAAAFGGNYSPGLGDVLANTRREDYRLVCGDGFEPPRLSEEGYSLPQSTTLPTTHLSIVFRNSCSDLLPSCCHRYNRMFEKSSTTFFDFYSFISTTYLPILRHYSPVGSPRSSLDDVCLSRKRRRPRSFRAGAFVFNLV